MSEWHFTWRQLYEIILNHVIVRIGNIWLQPLQTLKKSVKQVLLLFIHFKCIYNEQIYNKFKTRQSNDMIKCIELLNIGDM